MEWIVTNRADEISYLKIVHWRALRNHVEIQPWIPVEVRTLHIPLNLSICRRINTSLGLRGSISMVFKSSS